MSRFVPSKSLLHIDWIDYAVALFAKGTLDWASASAVSGLIGRAQGLLPSDLIELPVARMLVGVYAQHAALRAAIAAKPRGAQPLRTLLGDQAVRTSLVDTVGMLRVPALALSLPAPGEFAGYAAMLAGLTAPSIDEDLVDDAAVYCADFLRVFAQSSVDAVVVRETADRGALREFYAPIEKVADLYGWRFGLAVGDEPAWPDIRTVSIPVGSQPEAVLTMVKQLRA